MKGLVPASLHTKSHSAQRERRVESCRGASKVVVESRKSLVLPKLRANRVTYRGREREQFKRFEDLLPGGQGHDMASTVLHLPHKLSPVLPNLRPDRFTNEQFWQIWHFPNKQFERVLYGWTPHLRHFDSGIPHGATGVPRSRERAPP